jgi:hypothetical protein
MRSWERPEALEQTVILTATRNLVALGTALRLALNRCE